MTFDSSAARSVLTITFREVLRVNFPESATGKARPTTKAQLSNEEPCVAYRRGLVPQPRAAGASLLLGRPPVARVRSARRPTRSRLAPPARASRLTPRPSVQRSTNAADGCRRAAQRARYRIMLGRQSPRGCAAQCAASARRSASHKRQGERGIRRKRRF